MSDFISFKAEQLLSCVESKKYPFPDLSVWGKFCDLLINSNLVNKDPFPPALILAGWWYSSDEGKAHRFREHIYWTDKAELIDFADKYIRSLDDSAWLKLSV